MDPRVRRQQQARLNPAEVKTTEAPKLQAAISGVNSHLILEVAAIELTLTHDLHRCLRARLKGPQLDGHGRGGREIQLRRIGNQNRAIPPVEGKGLPPLAWDNAHAAQYNPTVARYRIARISLGRPPADQTRRRTKTEGRGSYGHHRVRTGNGTK